MNTKLMYDANDNRQNNPFCFQQIRYRDYKILGTSVIKKLKSTPSWLLLREKKQYFCKIESLHILHVFFRRKRYIKAKSMLVNTGKKVKVAHPHVLK